jgi:hypothetical protein
MVIQNDCWLYGYHTEKFIQMTYYDIIGTNMWCYPISHGVYKVHDPDVN